MMEKPDHSDHLGPDEVTPAHVPHPTPRPALIAPEILRGAALLQRVAALEAFVRNDPDWRDVPVKHFDHNDTLPGARDVGSHALYVLSEVRKLIGAGKELKANRWLGFAQGALWAAGAYTIHDLQEMGSVDE